jgi:hypothetical protein
VRTIDRISADELALLLSSWGYRPLVQWQRRDAACLHIEHPGLKSLVYLYGSTNDDGRFAVARFSLVVSSEKPVIQAWQLEDWNRKNFFGRLRRNEVGTEIDWTILLEETTEEYIKYCFYLWRGILVEFIKFYQSTPEND